jgi:hypothetical protein
MAPLRGAMSTNPHAVTLAIQQSLTRVAWTQKKSGVWTF